MIPFLNVCPEVAARETRSVMIGPGPGLPTGEYAFIEFYCEDRGCDCRRVFVQVISREDPDEVLASIIFGWERESFYRRKISDDPDAPRNITRGWLDPINEQSQHAPEFLKLFQNVVADAAYCLRLKRHYQLFKSTLEQRTALGNSFGAAEETR